MNEQSQQLSKQNEMNLNNAFSVGNGLYRFDTFCFPKYLRTFAIFYFRFSSCQLVKQSFYREVKSAYLQYFKKI